MRAPSDQSGPPLLPVEKPGYSPLGHRMLQGEEVEEIGGTLGIGEAEGTEGIEGTEGTEEAEEAAMV